jgi:hypothetical protein
MWGPRYREPGIEARFIDLTKILMAGMSVFKINYI